MEKQTLKPGDIVTIFQDPITQKKIEGKAELISIICRYPDNQEYWDIDFKDGGDTTQRIIVTA